MATDPNDSGSPTPAPGTPKKPDKIDLFPTATLERVVDETPPPKQPPILPGGPQTVTVPGIPGSHQVALPGAFDFRSLTGNDVETNRRILFGPNYEALSVPPGAPGDLRDHLSAEAALSMLPAAILGSLARPVVDKAYALIDYIPAPLRRPFQRDFGLLIDTALSVVGAAASPLASLSFNKFNPGGAGLPSSASIPLQDYGQTEMSCGLTAASTLMKAAGEPVSLNDTDAQLSGPTGGAIVLDEELRRRGFSVINGPTDLNHLKGFLAAGYPAMIAVGWEPSGGHIAVVSGYDDAKRQFTVNDWDADGVTRQVSYGELAAAWGRRLRYATIVIPQRDPRLDALVKMGDVRQPSEIYEGFSISNFWVTPSFNVFVEGAYRYVDPTRSSDITLRVSYDSGQDTPARRVGGSVAIRQLVAPGWYLGLKVEKMSLQYQTDDYSTLRKLPISIYGSVSGPGFELRAGGEHGAFQAAISADLGKLMAGLGLQASVSVDADGTYRLSANVAGNF